VLYISLDGGAEASIASAGTIDVSGTMHMGRAASNETLRGNLSAAWFRNTGAVDADTTKMDAYLGAYHNNAW